MNNFSKALAAARSFGAEAAANKQFNMNSGYRSDIAWHYGVPKWSDIPDEDQQKLMDAFRDGISAERDHII